MFTTQETDRLISEMAEREGRNKVTVRFVDPATLPPSKVTGGEQRPSIVRMRRGPADRSRAGAAERRRKIIECLDNLNGRSVPRRDISAATGIHPETLSGLLAALVASGIIKSSGTRGTARYWRPAEAADQFRELERQIEHEVIHGAPNDKRPPGIVEQPDGDAEPPTDAPATNGHDPLAEQVNITVADLLTVTDMAAKLGRAEARIAELETILETVCRLADAYRPT